MESSTVPIYPKHIQIADQLKFLSPKLNVSCSSLGKHKIQGKKEDYTVFLTNICTIFNSQNRIFVSFFQSVISWKLSSKAALSSYFNLQFLHLLRNIAHETTYKHLVRYITWVLARIHQQIKMKVENSSFHTIESIWRICSKINEHATNISTI